MIKKLGIFLLLLSSFILVGCTNDVVLTDGELLIQIRENITFNSMEITSDIEIPALTEEGVSVTWKSSDENFLDLDGKVVRPEWYEGNQLVDLLLTLQKGETVITKTFKFTIVAFDAPEEFILNTDLTDAYLLNKDFENKSFISDGIGEVELVRCVDGDTAIFAEGNETFTVRFLGIDTPESTAKIQPWGKAASNFTCEKLTNATKIVLEAEPTESIRFDSYGRYLSWVWYDSRLLNLELVEQAYSTAQGGAATENGSNLFEANTRLQFSEKRVWGEDDPNYDYSLEGIQVTIEELVTNYEEYDGIKVVITGVVTRTIFGRPFIEQDGYGLYLYKRGGTMKFAIGNEVQIAALFIGFHPDEQTGALQLTGWVNDSKTEVLSTGNEVIPNTVEINEITIESVGTLLEVKDLTIISKYVGDDGEFTLTLSDQSGRSIDIRVPDDAPDDILAADFNVGDVVDVIGPLSRYNSGYQLILCSLEDITIK